MIDLLAVCVVCTAGVPTQQSGIPSGDSLLDFPPRGLDITALNSRLCNDTLPRNQSKKLDGKQKTFVVLKILAICELEPLNRITSLRYVSSSLTRQFDCFHCLQRRLWSSAERGRFQPESGFTVSLSAWWSAYWLTNFSVFTTLLIYFWKKSAHMKQRKWHCCSKNNLFCKI